MWALRSHEVHSVIENDVGTEERHGGAVHSELSKLHRLIVTFPVVLAFRDPLESATRVGNLGVEVLKEHFGNFHRMYLSYFEFTAEHQMSGCSGQDEA